MLALFDQALHTLPATAPATASGVDSVAVLSQLHADVLRIAMTPGTAMGASFGHLAGGYSSAYYGYLWSDVVRGGGEWRVWVRR